MCLVPQEKTEVERQRILSQFQGLRLSLEEHSRHLLARLGDLERDIGKVQEENMTNLTKEISRLDARIQELEEKCRQPARTFLQVTRGNEMEPLGPAGFGAIQSRGIVAGGGTWWSLGVPSAQTVPWRGRAPLRAQIRCLGSFPAGWTRWAWKTSSSVSASMILCDSVTHRVPSPFSPFQDINGTLSRYGQGFLSSSSRLGWGLAVGSCVWPRLETKVFGFVAKSLSDGV